MGGWFLEMKIKRQISFLLLTVFLSLTCNVTFSSKAFSMSEFLETFSGVCFQNLGNFANLKPLLKFKEWEPLDDSLISILGKPANPDAKVIGYKKVIIEGEKALIVGLTTVPNTNQRVCTLAIIGDEDYQKTIQELERYFEVIKISSNREGIVETETWKIRHPMFDSVMLATQKHATAPTGKNLVQFHLIVIK